MRRTIYGNRRSTGILAGSLNTLVSLQRKTSGKDPLGQPIDTWTEYASVWGGVLMLTGKEVVTGGTQVATAACSIRIR
jgi:SPP1 family predicted phage head-tail adaptor